MFRRQDGAVLLVATLLLLVALAFALTLLRAPAGREGAGPRATERSLAEAREALLAYAADRPIDDIVGPGYLPCPDLDNDGWAESTCGSLAGDSGQDERLGRLPWKTLGIADLRDGAGERLWYAVSTKYKGLLNCAASAACVDMSPDVALGTITVRDRGGALVHDATIADPHRADEGGAAAVLIAAGAPNGLAGDNADFTDRGANGFTQASDRILAIGYRDLMPRIMRRVALEVAACLRAHVQASGSYPAPVPACSTSWEGVEDAQFGRVPDVSWPEACNLAPAAAHSWWKAWRRHVFYARGPGAIEIVDLDGRSVAANRDAAIIVAGPPLVRDGFAQHRDDSGPTDVRQWLEATNALLEGAGGCAVPPAFPCEAADTCHRITQGAARAGFNDVAIAIP
jgi:hypothetical protein